MEMIISLGGTAIIFIMLKEIVGKIKNIYCALIYAVVKTVLSMIIEFSFIGIIVNLIFCFIIGLGLVPMIKATHNFFADSQYGFFLYIGMLMFIEYVIYDSIMALLFELIY